MALTPFHLFAAIIAAHAPNAGGFDGLAVNAAGAGLGIAPQAHPEPFAQRRMDPFPGAIETERAKIVVDRLPGRPLLGQEPRGTARAELVKDSIEQGAPRMQTGAAGAWQGRQKGLDKRPLSVRQIGSIELGRHGSAYRTLPPVRISWVFRQFLTSCGPISPRSGYCQLPPTTGL